MPTTSIRASSLDEAADCPRRHAAKTWGREIQSTGYVFRRTLASVGSIIGRIAHEAVRKLLEAKRDGRLLTPQNAIIDSMPDFHKYLAEGVELDATTPDTDIAIRQIERSVTHWAELILPDVRPKLIEEHLEAKLDEDFALTGSVDLLTVDAILRDYKNEKATNSSHLAQAGAYSLLARTHGHDVKQIFIDRFVRQSANGMRNDPPKMRTIEYDLDTAERMAFNTAQRATRGLVEFRRRVIASERNPHEAFQPNPTSILCSPTYCPAHGTDFCPEGTSAKQQSEE